MTTPPDETENWPWADLLLPKLQVNREGEHALSIRPQKDRPHLGREAGVTALNRAAGAGLSRSHLLAKYRPDMPT
ncbi:hypothetical protein [Streptomyces violascens]|uniref:hypothetical protein n=1 Tax=Streptomyces violascens TaxID=67381 RepID=UPI003657B335